MRTIPMVAVAALAIAGAAEAQSPTAILRRATEAYDAVRTVRAEFEQTLVNPLTGKTVTATGVFYQRRPNQLAVRFTSPEGDVVVSDGKAVWVYLPSSAPKQVLKLPIGTNAAGALDLTAQFLEDPETRYTVTSEGTETIGSRTTDVLTLVPRAPMQFTRAKLWIDRGGVIRQLQVTEGSGVVRTVRFTTIDLNGTVPASAFSFTPPAGVKVFDQSGS